MKFLKLWYLYLLFPALAGIMLPGTAMASVDLDNPTINENCVDPYVVFEWSYSGGPKTEATNGYDIKISTNMDFSDPIEDESGLASATFTSTQLEYNTTYFWLATIHYTDFSFEATSGTFTTNGPPDLTYPADGQLCIDYTTPIFMWEDLGDADNYTITIATSNTFGGGEIVENSVAPSHTFTAAALTQNTTYYWRVVANYTGLCGSSSTFSEVRSFTTEADPPNLMSPANNATCVLDGAEFDWSDVAGAESYSLEYSTSSTFSSALTETIEDISSSSFTMPDGTLDNNEDYYWRVKAVINHACDTDWSGGWHLTTAKAPPTLAYPTDEMQGVELEPQLEWNTTDVPLTYDLQVAVDEDFTGLLYDETGLAPSTTFSSYFDLDDPAVPLDYNHTYYWRVRSNYTGCTSDWTETYEFYTGYPAVVLVSPIESETCISMDALLEWSPVIDAISYQVQVSENSDMDSPEVDVIDIDTNMYIAELTEDMTTYYWRVRAQDSTNVGLWSPIWSFTTTNAAPELIHPVDDSASLPLQVTFSWSSIGTGAQYDLIIDDNEDFSSPAFTESGLTGLSLTRTMPDYFQTYYWKVRGNLGGCTGDWSEPNMFTTSLPAPNLASPVNNAIKQSLWVTFSWDVSEGAETYEFQLSESTTFTQQTLIESRANLASNIYSASIKLDVQTKYYWRVRAHNSRGSSEWSNVFNFTTGEEGPVEPVLISPEDKSMNQPVTITLKWHPGERAETYRIQVSTNSYFMEPEYDVTGVSDTSYEITNLKNLRTYYWRVASESEYGTSNWTDGWEFTTIRQAPTDRPELVKPYNNSSNNPTTVTFYWNSVPRVGSYDFQLSTDPTFSSNLVDESGLLQARKTVSSLDINTQYYWRVRAINEAGEGPWSTIWSFTTMANSVQEELSILYNVTAVPNPFTEETRIIFTLPEASFVSLKVVNVLGETVAVPAENKFYNSGENIIHWRASGIESGVYFYMITIGDFTETKQVIISR